MMRLLLRVAASLLGGIGINAGWLVAVLTMRGWPIEPLSSLVPSFRMRS